MSQASYSVQVSSEPDSLESDERSVNREVSKYKEEVYEKADTFGRTLDNDVRRFTRNTRTTVNELRGMITCLDNCIDLLNTAWTESSGLKVLDEVAGPIANPSLELNIYQLASNARKLFKFLKSRTLEALDPPTSTNDKNAKLALHSMEDALIDRESLVQHVMHEGYDCNVSSESSEEE